MSPSRFQSGSGSPEQALRIIVQVTAPVDPLVIAVAQAKFALDSALVQQFGKVLRPARVEY